MSARSSVGQFGRLVPQALDQPGDLIVPDQAVRPDPREPARPRVRRRPLGVGRVKVPEQQAADRALHLLPRLLERP